MPMPTLDTLRFLGATGMVFVVDPARRMLTPVYNMQRVKLARLVEACGYELLGGNHGEIVRRLNGDIVSRPFKATGTAGMYGFMGMSGLPVDLNLTRDQHRMRIKSLCQLFQKMLTLADQHEVDHNLIPKAFDLAASLRQLCDARYYQKGLAPVMLNYEQCLQVIRDHGSKLNHKELLTVISHATTLSQVNEIISLQARVPNSLVYEMYPLAPGLH